eukprot:283608-Amphidinium_carterae.1
MFVCVFMIYDCLAVGLSSFPCLSGVLRRPALPKAVGCSSLPCWYGVLHVCLKRVATGTQSQCLETLRGNIARDLAIGMALIASHTFDWGGP